MEKYLELFNLIAIKQFLKQFEISCQNQKVFDCVDDIQTEKLCESLDLLKILEPQASHKFFLKNISSFQKKDYEIIWKKLEFLRYFKIQIDFEECLTFILDKDKEINLIAIFKKVDLKNFKVIWDFLNELPLIQIQTPQNHNVGVSSFTDLLFFLENYLIPINFIIRASPTKHYTCKNYEDIWKKNNSLTNKQCIIFEDYLSIYPETQNKEMLVAHYGIGSLFPNLVEVPLCHVLKMLYIDQQFHIILLLFVFFSMKNKTFL